MFDAKSFDEVLTFNVTDKRTTEQKNKKLPPFKVETILHQKSILGNWEVTDSMISVDYVNGETFRIWLNATNVESKDCVDFYVVVNNEEIGEKKQQGEKDMITIISDMIKVIAKCKNVNEFDANSKAIFRVKMSLR